MKISEDAKNYQNSPASQNGRFHCSRYLRDLQYFSINFQVTITFLAIGLVDGARLSGDSYWLPGNYNIFFKMAAFKIDSYRERRYWEIWVR